MIKPRMKETKMREMERERGEREREREKEQQRVSEMNSMKENTYMQGHIKSHAVFTHTDKPHTQHAEGVI